MSPDNTVLVGLVMLVGLIGVFVPILPGLVLIWAATLLWVINEDGTVRWLVLAISTLLLVASLVLKYVIPARNVQKSGAPTATLLVGLVGAVIGFFVIPVVGFIVGGVIGILLAEYVRLRSFAPAGRSTMAAIVGIGIGVLIELFAGVAMILVWLAAVLAT
jgi:uncharacterized protein YqgC (DUF456 family)